MRPRSRAAVFVAAAFLIAESLSSQEILNLRLIDNSPPDLMLEFDLRSATSGPIQSLSAAQARVEESGEAISGNLLQGPFAEGAAYLPAVDTSGSVETLLPEIRAALGWFVERLGVADRAALISFNDKVQVEAPFLAGRGELLPAIEELAPGGRFTELYYAVCSGLEIFEADALPDGRVLVVVSDGKDEGKAYTLDECVGKARSLGVEIHGLGIARGDPRDLLNIEKMISSTEGWFVEVGAGDSWAQKVADLHRLLVSQWRYSWRTALPFDAQSQPVLLRVTFEDGSTVSEAFELELSQGRTARERTRSEAGPLMFFVILIAALLIWWLLRRSRRQREELQRTLDDERRRRDVSKLELKRQLVAARAELDDLSAEAAESEEAAEPTSEESSTEKRKTVFRPGPPAEALSYETASLEVLDGPSRGVVLPLGPGRTVLGRADDNDIVVDEDRVSHYHAAIIGSEGSFLLEDLESTNGTSVDGGPPITGKVPLRDGNRLRIGRVNFLFRGEA